jgi:hypothetical protein
MKRRNFIYQSSSIAGLTMAGLLFSDSKSVASLSSTKFQKHNWLRDINNPIFPTGGGWFDKTACMNPFVVTHEGMYWLFYAGGDEKGAKRICLATTPMNDLKNWKRYGPLFDLGSKDAFDETWCVLPCVHRIGDKWHLYYTGRAAHGDGLQAFRGIGLATSTDLINWKKISSEPIILGGGFPEWPDNKGIAGGGSIIEVPQPDGRILYRMYHTLTTGHASKDLLVDQAKQSVIVHSYDGLNWFDKRVVLRPRLDATYENAATIALTVWRTKSGKWRALYAGIGTMFGYYSICEAKSNDGLNWERGAPGENLALPPGNSAWENQMTEYPNIVHEGNNIRLFYCGNGYGSTGIGTAVAKALD